MKLSDNAMAVLKKRYLLTNELGKQETPEEMFMRVAVNIAQAEELYGGGVADKVYEFYNMMHDLKFIPNSPTLMNAGTDIQQLSACFVLPIEDSMDGIFKTVRDAALIFKSGGGVGCSFSRLRGEGFPVGKSGGTSSGPISFMQVFDSMTEAVKQAGKRRGALMGVLRVDHPDIRKFITCKSDTSKLNNFNTSIALTDKFMKAVEKDETYLLTDMFGSYLGVENAREIFNLIIENAWNTGEPGILFIDEINRHNPTPHVGEIESSNPCLVGATLVETKEHGVVPIHDILGEQVELKLKDVFVKTTHQGFFCKGKKDVYTIRTNGEQSITATLNHKLWACHRSYEGDKGKVGWYKVSELKIGDTLIRHENGSGDQILSITSAGKMKVYDCQVPIFNAYNANIYISHNCGEVLALPYESCNLGSINLAKHITFDDSDEPEVDWMGLEDTIYSAVNFLDNVIDMNKFPLAEIEEMTKGNRKIGLGIMGFADLLFELGIPYGSEHSFDIAKWVMEYISNKAFEASEELAKERGVYPNCNPLNEMEPKLRNATLTSIAPTGTISMIAGCSSGCEPAFALAYKRTIMDGTEMYEVNPVFKEVLEAEGLYSEELMEKVAKSGSIQHLEEIPLEIRKVFVTAHDITPEQHVRMQAAFQEYVDNAISKTVNLPHNATQEDVSNVYKLAYELKTKGVTIYRDGCRDNQVLSTGNTYKQEEDHNTMEKLSRDYVVKGETRKVQTGCGCCYVTINKDSKGNPIEIFCNMGKAGGCASSQLESIARLISLAFKNNISIETIIKQLKGISCNKPAWVSGGNVISSCADAVALALTEYAGLDKIAKKENTNEICPECSNILVRADGCISCHSCGFSKCGG